MVGRLEPPRLDADRPGLHDTPGVDVRSAVPIAELGQLDGASAGFCRGLGQPPDAERTGIGAEHDGREGVAQWLGPSETAACSFVAMRDLTSYDLRRIY